MACGVPSWRRPARRRSSGRRGRRRGGARPRTRARRAGSRRSVIPYQSRPTPIAFPVGTPSGCSSSTSRPSRIPRPDSEIGSTWADRHRGDEGEHRAVGNRDAERVDRAPDRDHAPTAWYAIAATSTLTARRGSRRMRSTPTCTAPMKRIQFSCLAKRPARRGLAGDDEDHDEADDRGAGDGERDPRVSQSSSDGSMREAEQREQRERDETAQPLDDHRREGDVAGAGGLRRPAHAQDVAADRRREHVAHELAGEVVASSVRSGTWTSNTASTRCQRHAESTKPTNVNGEAGGEEGQRAGVGVLRLDARRPGSW